MGVYRLLTVTWDNEEIMTRKETTTYELLSNDLLGGFSDEMIDKFFRPFYQGIYLAPLEEQSSRMFEFVFRMFATGAAALPAGGIGAVGTQLGGALAELPNCRVELSTPVSAVEQGKVTLADGRTISCEQVVVATEGPVAAKLLEGKTKAPLTGRFEWARYEWVRYEWVRYERVRGRGGQLIGGGQLIDRTIRALLQTCPRTGSHHFPGTLQALLP